MLFFSIFSTSNDKNTPMSNMLRVRLDTAYFAENNENNNFWIIVHTENTVRLS